MTRYIKKGITPISLAFIFFFSCPAFAGDSSSVGVLVSLPKTGDPEDETLPEDTVAAEPDELFAGQCLEYFKNRNYLALYNEMSDNAQKMPFNNMVALFCAEEKILGQLKEYTKSGRVPPAGSASPVSFQYVCIFDKSDGVVMVDIVTENNRMKISEFKVLSSALFTKEAKELLSQIKAEPE